MKKKVILFVVILSTIILLTGCNQNNSEEQSSKNKTLICHKEKTDADGYKTTDSIVVTYNDMKVLRVKNTNVVEIDPKYIEISLTIGKNLAKAVNKVSGVRMVYEKVDANKIKTVLEINYEEINLKEIKEALGELYTEDNLYTAKDLNIDAFRGKQLQGYTCE